MSGEFYFYELPRNYYYPERCFSLRRYKGSLTLPCIYLEFDARHGRWHLVRHSTDPPYSRNTIMELEGTSDDPPIDLALATLTLMGY